MMERQIHLFVHSTLSLEIWIIYSRAVSNEDESMLPMWDE